MDLSGYKIRSGLLPDLFYVWGHSEVVQGGPVCLCSACMDSRLGSVLPATTLVASSDCALLVDGADGVSVSDSPLPLLRARLRSREVSRGLACWLRSAFRLCCWQREG